MDNLSKYIGNNSSKEALDTFATLQNMVQSNAQMAFKERQIQLQEQAQKAQLANTTDNLLAQNVNARTNYLNAWVNAGGKISKVDLSKLQNTLPEVMEMQMTGMTKGERDIIAKQALEQVKITGRKDIVGMKGMEARETQKQKDTAAGTRQKRKLAVDVSKEMLTPAEVRKGKEAVEELDVPITSVHTGQDLVNKPGVILNIGGFNINSDDIINIKGSRAYEEVHPQLGISLLESLKLFNNALAKHKNNKKQLKQTVDSFVAAYPELEGIIRGK